MSISMIGLDTAKSVFQIHGVNGSGKVELKRKLRRSELIAFFEKQESCTVVMEACGAAHHWARMLTGLGHTVKLIAAEAVKPFVKKGKKNDAADAAAICEAASRPDAKFVPAKTVQQQGILALHAARSLLVKQQTMLANAMRGLATEFGVTVPKGIRKLDELMTLVDTDETIPKQVLKLCPPGREITASLVRDRDIRCVRVSLSCRKFVWGRSHVRRSDGSRIEPVRRAFSKPDDPIRIVNRNRARHSCEIHPRLGRLQKRFSVRIGHAPRSRRFLPSRARADLSAEADQLRVPWKLDDRHGCFLARESWRGNRQLTNRAIPGCFIPK
jgi:Transposase